MTKPDRCERVVAKGFPYKQVRPQDLIRAQDAIKLLRAEHRAVVRLVKRMRRRTCADTYNAMYNEACDDILAALKRRKK